jgi:uncharacterized protein YjiS (DUF1127 family)
MKKYSTGSIGGVVRLNDVRSQHGEARLNDKNPAQVYPAGLADDNFNFPPHIAEPGRSGTIWSSLVDHFIFSFALCGASLHPTALFSIQDHFVGENGLRPRPAAVRKPRPALSLVRPLPRSEAAAEKNNDRLVLEFRMPVQDEGPGDWGAPPSLPVEPPNRWRWFKSAWQVIATLWAHLRNEWQVTKAIAALSKLDDRTLRDMGIQHRSHIEHMVRYCRDC